MNRNKVIWFCKDEYVGSLVNILLFSIEFCVICNVNDGCVFIEKLSMTVRIKI